MKPSTFSRFLAASIGSASIALLMVGPASALESRQTPLPPGKPCAVNNGGGIQWVPDGLTFDAKTRSGGTVTVTCKNGSLTAP